MCKNCYCDSCRAQRKQSCRDCNKLSPELETHENWGRCNKCAAQIKHAKIKDESVQGEWGRSAAMELKVHANDVQQPLRRDGTINPHFVKVHGTKTIEKELKFSKKQIYENLENYG